MGRGRGAMLLVYLCSSSDIVGGKAFFNDDKSAFGQIISEDVAEDGTHRLKVFLKNRMRNELIRMITVAVEIVQRIYEKAEMAVDQSHCSDNR